MKKIDFRKIEVKNVEGNPQEFDLDYKSFANYMYFNAESVDHIEISREINKGGEIQCDAEKASAIKKYAEIYFKAFVLEALNPVLDEIINPKK